MLRVRTKMIFLKYKLILKGKKLKNISEKEDIADSKESDILLVKHGQDENGDFIVKQLKVGHKQSLENEDNTGIDIQPIVIIQNENDTLIHMSKYTVIRNLLIISISFMLLFSAFNSFSSLQSSLNKEDGLGTTGLASVYLFTLLSCLFVAPVTMSMLSTKWVMVISMFTYLLFIATGFYPSWYIVIPASVFVGIGTSHLWLAVQSYITDISKHYSTITNTKPQDRLTIFLGIFYAFTYTCNVWGNLMSSFIFHQSESNTTNDIDSTVCGAYFCPYIDLNTTTDIIGPTRQQVNMYVGACVGLVMVALCFITFLLTNISTEKTSGDVRMLVQQVTKLLCFNRSQHLLFFPTLLGGLTVGFVFGDFTQAYVTCPYGVQNVGFVMVAYGIGQSASSLIFGKLTQYTGHLFVMCFGYMVNLGTHVTLLLWTPAQSEQYVVFILAAMFGIVGAVNIPLISALYNLYFPEDRVVAVSSFRTISSLGMVVSMAYSNWICSQYKLYILLSVLTISCLSLIIQHVRHRRKTKGQED